MMQISRCGAQNIHSVKAHDAVEKPSNFVSWTGSLCHLERSRSRGEYGLGGEEKRKERKRWGKREERKGKIRRDGVDGESSHKKGKVIQGK